MTKLLLPFLLLFFTLDGAGQITFEKNITGSDGEENRPKDIQETPDGGFAIVGVRSHEGINSGFLMKTNQFGDTTWVKYYQSLGNSVIIKNFEVLNDGFIFICNIFPTSNNLKNFIVRTDVNGDVIWSKSFHENFPNTCVQVIKSEEGGYIVSGTVNSPNSPSNKILTILKLDSSGNIEWNKKYETSTSTSNIGITQINGEYYVINTHYILKINQEGDTLGSFTVINPNATTDIVLFAKSSDNCLLLYMTDYDLENNILKMNPEGNILWSKYVHWEEEMSITSINQTNAGGCTVAWRGGYGSNWGYHGSSGFSNFNFNGELLFVHRKNEDQVFSKVINNVNNNFTFLIDTYSDIRQDFIQTNSSGNTSCSTISSQNNYAGSITLNSISINQTFSITSPFTDSIINIQTKRLSSIITTKCNSISNLNESDTLNVSGCGSYTLNNQTYTQSDEYIQLVSNQNGTFDTISLVVNIIPNSSFTQNITACYHYQLPTAVCDDCGYVNNSGIYHIYDLQNTAGCDSLIDYDLTIDQYDEITIYKTVCGSYTVQNMTYTTSGIYNYSNSYEPLCDTNVTLYLTIVGPTTATLNETACNSYSLNNQTYTQSGTYIQTLQNVAGCDSTITLNLTINNPTTATLNETACSSYSLNNQTYTQSGTYIQTLQTANGCDSTITLNLTINQNSLVLNETACNNYTLNNQTYAQSGTYFQTLQNANGCDSTITLNLTISQNAITLNETACDSYTLNSQTYTESGTYFQNVAGCDSIITLNLIINNATTSTLNATACNSYSLNNQTYTQSGTYIQTLQNVNGCDSTITLNLTINTPTTSTLNKTACDSYSLNNQTYTQSGNYIQTLQNANGCDSTITLNLTIININPAITNNSNILTAQQSNASYQWIDCDLDALIPGATNQSFTPTHVGEYAVRLAIGNCTETSNCVLVNNVSLDEIQLENNFEIFPNPFTSEAKIVFNIPQTNTKIQLLDMLGKELQSVSFSGTEFTIYRESLSASMYFVQITDPSGKVTTRKIVLE